MSSPGERFRRLLAERDVLLTVGAFDGLSARLVEQAGGDVVSRQIRPSASGLAPDGDGRKVR